ncbi:MAG: putative esterase/lipase LipP [Planctomycetaceae bacterium]|nr:MAG: putative esterase/lipase LipP [Planctomycetaceae bacterium]
MSHTSTITSADQFRQAFPRASHVFEQGLAKGLHYGALVTIIHRGQWLVDVGLGRATPDTSMPAKGLFFWLSAGKPLTAVLIGRFVERGLLRWDDPVKKYWPEFGQNHKDGITLRHLLTHTAGIRLAETGWPDVPWEQTMRQLAQATLDPHAVPGQTAGYHVMSSWFVLGEIIRRVSGLSFCTALRLMICEPAGLTQTWAAWPHNWCTEPMTKHTADQFLHKSVSSPSEDYDPHLLTGPPPQATLLPIYERQGEQLVGLGWEHTARCFRPSPGSSLRGSLEDLARFYQCLYEDLHDAGHLLTAATLREMTRRHRQGQFDVTLGQTVDFGLGFILQTPQPRLQPQVYGYGRGASLHTFGHAGSQSSQAFLDPEHELIIAHFFNGRCGEPQHQRRITAFNESLYFDLGIT